MNKTNNIFDRLQRSSAMLMYAALCILLFIAGFRLLQYSSTDFGGAYAVYILVFLMATLTFGAWFWVVLTIPGEVAREFDTIKNKVSTGEISSITEFSEELAEFMTRYFHFVGFDIVLAVVKIKYGKAISSDNNYAPEHSLNTEWIALSKSTQDVVNAGKLNYLGQKLHGYLIPIWFGNEWLGYMVIYTDTRLLKSYRHYLNTFEDIYIDDQVLHVLHRDDNSNALRLCHGTDNLARETEDKSIENPNDYLTKLLDLLLRETGCKAGFIKLSKNKHVISSNIEESIIHSIDTPVSDKTFRPDIPGFEIATVKIIFLPDEQISLVLLGETYESIILARSLFDSCMTDKIKKQYSKLADAKDNQTTTKG